MSLYFSHGSETTELSAAEIRDGLYQAFDALGARRKVLALPPDFTRYHSRAGELTRCAWQYYGDRLTDVLPALGTHVPMTDCEIGTMFGDMPRSLFRVHDWRARARARWARCRPSSSASSPRASWTSPGRRRWTTCWWRAAST